ncbi:hypothetical protein EDEG_02734 [Edhazardia aedis USNM 41457]|uniref:Uncharacterized protein n=1 Tax=Edhazardia aedis (strain USNM 41457) TaxID=1003232 RepID=J9D5N2_EDHAE|nr:hypothetical protein EDEG_02734 [Edhazardia aedis USNM 41457]|eukprot:EJW02854.1 hypothetical protein EDEG_02734 [Edhazardia aedis USNM 41457]
MSDQGNENQGESKVGKVIKFIVIVVIILVIIAVVCALYFKFMLKGDEKAAETKSEDASAKDSGGKDAGASLIPQAESSKKSRIAAAEEEDSDIIKQAEFKEAPKKISVVAANLTEAANKQPLKQDKIAFSGLAAQPEKLSSSSSGSSSKRQSDLKESSAVKKEITEGVENKSQLLVNMGNTI